jgi:hypothetical protein
LYVLHISLIIDSNRAQSGLSLSHLQMQDKVFQYVDLSWIHTQSAKLKRAEPNQGARCQIVMSVAERENRVSVAFIVCSQVW